MTDVLSSEPVADVRSNATVRRAKGSDASSIASLYAQLVNNPAVSVLPQTIDALAANGKSALLVCEVDAQVFATALVCLCEDVMFTTQPFAVVENVVVDSALRGQGIGRALFQAIEDFCRDSQCSKIMLMSSASRTDAHRFFERAGYAGSVKRGFVKYRRDFAPLPAPPVGINTQII